MDSLRPNTSSAMAGIVPHYVPYQASDSAADPLPAAPDGVRNGSGSGPVHPAGSSSYDSIHISSQARRLYDVSVRMPGSAVPPTGLAPENLALYNQIHREREALPFDDPRIMELTDRLRAVLMAGDKALDAEDLGYRPAQASPLPEQTTDQGAFRSAASSSKNRQTLRPAAYSQDSVDTAGFAFALPYPAPEASAEAAPFSARASASVSPRLYRAAQGTLDFAPADPAVSRHISRVA